MAPNIQFKRGTAATFHTLNPVLLKGEPGLETDTSKIKFGDGVTAWRDLPYANPDLETLDGGEEMLPPVPSAPGSFSPPDVDGLTLWMDATHGDYIHKVDNKVSVWEDMSPERVRFVQSLKASRPLVSSQIEAQDVVTFDGSNDAMISNFQVPEEFTLLVAFRRNGVRAEARVVTAVDSEGENEVVLLGTDSGASFGASVGGSYSALQPVDDMVAVVYALRSTAEGFATRLNGLNQQVGDSPIPVGSERICMGSSRANFSTGAFSGDVAEVVMYDSYLSDADLKDVEEYMMARWGVVAVQHPLLEGMKAFWPLNEEGGDRFDITDAEVPLSPTGTVGFAPGVIENAAEFTGGNNYLQAPTDFSLSGSFSISLWFKASVMSGGRSALVQNWAAGNASGQVELGFGDEGSDSSAVFARIATDEDIYSVVVPNFEANLWFHVAMVYSSDDNTLTLYCDGQQAAQVATLGNFNAGNIPFRVGISDQTSTQNDLSFLADQIGFWERALGTNEVQMLYNYELGKEDFAADFYGDEVSLLLHMDKPANAVGESGGGGGGGGGGPTIDPDFDKVSLLLKMDGANGSTTFTDSSPNTLTVTANGNASISTAQSKFGGASGYFDGTSASKLVISEDANFGENDFTIEAWVWIDVNTCNTDGPCICEIGSHSQGLSAFGSDGLIFMVGFRSGNWIAWGWIGPDQGSGALPYTSEPITPGQWTHLAMTRQNGVFRLFVDGVKGAEDTRYVNIIGSDNSIQIGGSLNGSATNSFGGYIDDLRITKGLARYTADFAPPTASHPLGYTKVVTMPTVETSLLLHFDGADGSTTFSDSGQNARTVTANGGAVISNAQSKFGGTSAYFAGTPATGSSQLSIPTNTNFGTADFTVEAWIWIDENTTAAGWSDGPGIVELGSHSALGNDGIIFMTGLRSGSWIAWAWCNPFGGGIPFTSNTITPGQWTHVAWTRQGNVFRIFIDGIKGTEYTSSASIPASDNSIQIGGSLNGATANAFGGYIDEVRVIKGAALYTDNFTPPALPFPNPPAGPALLLHFDGSNGSATFTDSSPLNAAINPWGNPVISTAQSKFGGSSLYLDGNSYLRTNDAPAFELRTGDFTVEAWINTSSSSEQTILSMWDCNQAQFLMKVSNYQAMILWATDQPIPPETYYGGTITPGEWTHLAFTRAGSVGRVFLNGIEVINFTATDSFQPATTAIQIGKEANCYSANWFIGYIDEFRVTKGQALYTANFTPPTAPFPNPGAQPAPDLLLHFDGADGSTTFTDSGQNQLAVTRSGNAAISTTQSRFGGSSVYFGGAGNGLTVEESSAVRIGSADFTIEFWVYNSGAGQHFIGRHITGVGANWLIGIVGGNLYWESGTAGTATFSSQPVPSNEWAHIAVTRSSGVSRSFINGVLVATGNASGSLDDSILCPLTIGADSTFANAMTGYIDELRIVKGRAIYTEDFNPPAAPFLNPTVTLVPPPGVDPHINNVSLLLHMDGENNGTTFVDSSPNALAVVATGDAVVSTGEIKFGSASGYFNGGSNSFLTVPASANFAYGTDDFTIECWVNSADLSSWHVVYSQSISGNNYCVLGAENGQVQFVFNYSNPGAYVYGGTITAGTWHHIAVCRKEGVATVYVDGVGGTPAACTFDFANTTFTPQVGSYGHNTSYNFDGYIDELRVTKGVARYTGDFTPPTSAFPSATSGGGGGGGNGPITTFIDTSKHNHEVTAAGSAYLNLTDIKYGNASGEFAGGHCEIAMSPEFAFDNGDFTVEFWGKLNYAANSAVFSTAPNSQAAGTYLVGFSDDTNMFGFCHDIEAFVFCAANIAEYYNTWTHYAFVRLDGVLKMYINGDEVATATANVNLDGGDQTTAVIGRRWTDQDNHYLDGLIDELRITKGAARYASEFNPPSKAFPDPLIPFVAPPNNGDQFAEYVTLLLHMDGADGSTNFVDNSYLQNEVTAEGNAAISTAQSKFGGTSCYFDGSGSYLDVIDGDVFDFGTGDFTIEAWIYKSTSNVNQFIASSSGNNGMFFGFDGSDNLGVGRTSVAWDHTVVHGIYNDTWTHVAVSRSNSSIRFFVNGTQVGSTLSDYTPYDLSAGSLTIGSQGNLYFYTGYIDDLRITKGVARYTENFTLPTVPFPSPFVPGPTADVKPTDVTGCDLWLDSTADISTNAGAVTVWPDKSGSGRAATPADYAPAPTLALGEGPVGQNVVRFSGDPNVLDVSYQFNLKNSSGLILLGQTVPPPDCAEPRPERVISFQPASGFDWQNNDGMLLHHTQNAGGGGSNDLNLYSNGQVAEASVSCPLGWSLVSYVIDDFGNVRFRLNGVDEDSASFSAIANKAGAELLVGHGGDFSQSSALRGDIAEIALFDHALGDAALVALERGIVARCLPPPSPPTYELFDGLVGYWPLNGDANDYTANNYDLTGDGPSGFGNGRINGGLVCSGAGGYYYPSNALFNTYGNNYSVTMNLWFKTNATDGTIEGGRPHLISTVPEAPPYWGWRLCWENNSFFAGLNGEGGGLTLFADGLYCDGQWHMVTLVIDTATHMAEFWIDGQKKDESAFVGEIGGQYAKLTVGYREGLFNGYFYGSIDEVGIWGRSLDGVEIAELYDGGAGLDPIPPSSLLLHFDGETFTDSSVNALAVTANGGAVISAAQSVFGGASLHLPAKGDYLSVQSSEGFNFGDGDFTIEFWLYLENNSDGGVIVYTNNSSSFGWGVWIRWENDTWNMVFDVPGIIAFVYPISMTTGGWHHLAFARQGSQLMMFNDGTQAAAVGFNYTVSGGTDEIVVGYPASVAGPSGYIDELRIVKGVALYTSNFTPPTGPYNS